MEEGKWKVNKRRKKKQQQQEERLETMPSVCPGVDFENVARE